jgi:hypothetical protein
MKQASSIQAGLAIVSTAAGVMMSGCTPQPSQPAAVINDKIYAVTPNAMKVKAGIVTGNFSDMKVTERVEEGSGRVASPAKLTGTLVLKNVSADQSVRLLTGKIVYIDTQGRPLKLENARIEPTLSLSSSYGTAERLDPGQEKSQSVDAEFPVEALKLKKLKDIRIELSYIPSAYKEEALNFPVSIGGK